MYQIQRKGDMLHVKVDGESYAKTPYTNNHRTAASVFETLAERHEDSKFRWWHAQRDYYRAGAPENWEGEYDV